MRTHIAKSLQVRCKTIKKAVAEYNTVAKSMVPPKPSLDWSEVTHYAFLEEFSLLQDTRNDIRQKPWAQPVIRETIKLYRRVEHAKEELQRLNIEVRRLHTAIKDEAELFRVALLSLGPAHPLHGAMQKFIVHRQAVNDHLLRRIHQVYALPGYSGIRGPSMAENNMLSAASLPSPLPTMSHDVSSLNPTQNGSSVAADSDDDDDDDGDGAGDDEARDSMGAIVDYIAGLSMM